jgi:glycosyltransferase involved in cell wall biosynthesis
MQIVHWMPLNVDGTSIIGGHKTQIENTVKHLIQNGVDATIEFGEHPHFSSNCIVHLYGGDESAIYGLKRAGVHTVLSPIYWPEYINDNYANTFHRSFVKCKGYLSFVKKLLLSGINPELTCFRLSLKYAKMSRMYSMVDLIIPNSNLEATAIRNDLNILTRTVAVPLGVDRTLFYENSESRSKDKVLYVGRIEPHKNQLKLVKAIKGQPYRLILAGQLHPHHQDYCRRVLSHCTKNITYAGSGDTEFVRNLYNSASVHILPSWSETVGLASLEAAACNCKVIHTKNGFGREYFGDTTSYCDPGSTISIRQTIHNTMFSDTVLSAQSNQLTRYTWENTATELIRAYESLSVSF